MKKIILLLLTVFVLFSCQSEMDIEPNFISHAEEVNTRSGNLTLFDRLFDDFKKRPGKTGIIPLTGDEKNRLFWNCMTVFGYYPMVESWGEELCLKNVKLYLGRDTKLTVDEGNGYYDAATDEIFFRKNFEIQQSDILHELLHAVQHHIMGYEMKTSFAQKNIEYEAYVARDLFECIRRNGQFEFAGAMGIPTYELRMEYKAWIEELSICALTGKDFEGILMGKFNTWTKDWKSYTNKSWDSKFFPSLLYHIIRNTERWN